MDLKNKRGFKPRLVDVDVRIERDIFKDRIQRQDLIKNHSGLCAQPAQLPDESLLVRGFATVLQQSEEDIIVQHPLSNLRLLINNTVGARYGYLISCGDYQQQMLDMIQKYIQKGDQIIEIGAGLGVTTAYLGLCTGQKVVALEPQEKLHDVIRKNCQLNAVAVEVIHGSITPDIKDSETDFHIMHDYLSSSLFQNSGDVDISIKVPQVNIEHIIQKTTTNTLVFDIMGAEIGLVYEDSIQKFNKIICALNTPIIGEEKTAHIINHLTKNGFDLKNIHGLIFVFTRK